LSINLTLSVGRAIAKRSPSKSITLLLQTRLEGGRSWMTRAQRLTRVSCVCAADQIKTEHPPPQLGPHKPTRVLIERRSRPAKRSVSPHKQSSDTRQTPYLASKFQSNSAKPSPRVWPFAFPRPDNHAVALRTPIHSLSSIHHDNVHCYLQSLAWRSCRPSL
jgi:hypothetical protein